MAVGLKYFFEFPGKDQVQYRVEIGEEGYVGGTTELEPEVTPVLVRLLGDANFKLDIIKGLRSVISFKSSTSFQFQEFFTVFDDQYRIDILRDGVLWLRHWMVPMEYAEPYWPQNYPVQLVGTDGLGRLKNFLYQPSGARESALLVLLDCLNQIGSELPIYEAIDIYENDFADDTGNSGLAQTFVDTDAFSGLSCYDVVREILKIFSSKIQQEEGAWIVTRVNQNAKPAGYFRRAFDKDGNIITPFGGNNFELFDPTDTVDNADKIIISKETTLGTEPGYKFSTINFVAGPLDNLIIDGEFEEGAFNTAGDALVTWTVTGLTISREVRNEIGSVYAVGFPETGDTFLDSNKMVSQPVTVAEGNNNGLEFRWQHKIETTGATGVAIHFQVRVGTQYLQADLETWDTFPAWLEEPVSLFNQWADSQVIRTTIPEDGEFQFSFAQTKVTSGTVDKTQLDRAICTFFGEEGSVVLEQQIFAGEIAGRNTRANEFNTILGDAAGFINDDFLLGTYARCRFGVTPPTIGGEEVELGIPGRAGYLKVYFANTDFTNAAELANAIRADLDADWPGLYAVTGGSLSCTVTALTYGDINNFAPAVNPPSSTSLSVEENVANVDPVGGGGATLNGLSAGALTTSSGNVTSQWHRQGVTEDRLILDLMLQSTLNLYQRPTQRIINGSLFYRTSGFGFHKILEDQISNPGHRFMLMGGEFDARRSEIRGSWQEVIDTEASFTATVINVPRASTGNTSTQIPIGSGSPGGADKSIQWNNNGAFDGFGRYEAAQEKAVLNQSTFGTSGIDPLLRFERTNAGAGLFNNAGVSKEVFMEKSDGTLQQLGREEWDWRSSDASFFQSRWKILTSYSLYSGGTPIQAMTLDGQFFRVNNSSGALMFELSRNPGTEQHRFLSTATGGNTIYDIQAGGGSVQQIAGTGDVIYQNYKLFGFAKITAPPVGSPPFGYNFIYSDDVTGKLVVIAAQSATRIGIQDPPTDPKDLVTKEYVDALPFAFAGRAAAQAVTISSSGTWEGLVIDQASQLDDFVIAANQLTHNHGLAAYLVNITSSIRKTQTPGQSDVVELRLITSGTIAPAGALVGKTTVIRTDPTQITARGLVILDNADTVSLEVRNLDSSRNLELENLTISVVRINE